MIKKIRSEQLHGTNSSKIGVWAANNFSMINNSVPTLLNTVNMAHKVREGGCMCIIIISSSSRPVRTNIVVFARCAYWLCVSEGLKVRAVISSGLLLYSNLQLS
jgi:hypothetical protein